MENVTLKPKEQARLQVLNSLLAEHMTLDQAAALMGVSPRHTRRILAGLPGKRRRLPCPRPPGPQASQRYSRGDQEQGGPPGSHGV